MRYRQGARGFGLTWWNQQWIATPGGRWVAYANRLPRRRSYAVGGTVTDLKAAPRVVTVRVTGSRARPYRVMLKIPAFDDAQWLHIATGACNAPARTTQYHV